MERPNINWRITRAGHEQRESIYGEVYDGLYEDMERQANHMRPPARRRQKRISIYKAVIGVGHDQVLEIGCGMGDLTYALTNHAKKVIGIDVSAKALEFAWKRRCLRIIGEDQAEKVKFLQMSGMSLDFPSETFDYVVSTSMIEHLHPDDVRPHLQEVWRVLNPRGRYLVWCPNRLGHHKDRDGHLSMFSYGELMEKMTWTGFREFRSPVFNRPPMVDARFKVLLEQILYGLGITILWSHLGVRNILLVAKK